MRLLVFVALLCLGTNSFSAMKVNVSSRESTQRSSCKVCTELIEAECIFMMKDIIREMKPRARLQALSPMLDPASCFGLNDDDCMIETSERIESIGIETVARRLMNECNAGEVVLSNPSVMRFEFSSLHSSRTDGVLKGESETSADRVISSWRENCSHCVNEVPGVTDGDDLCAEKLLLTFSKLPNQERLMIFEKVFEEQSCTKLASSKAECLSVFETKFARSNGRDRKALAFAACSKGLLGNKNHVLSKATPRRVVSDVPLLMSKCPACVPNEGVASCNLKLYKSFTELPDKDRLKAFENGILRESLVAKACGSDGVSQACLDKLDRYLSLLNNDKVSKSLKGAAEHASVDLSLVTACAHDILPAKMIRSESHENRFKNSVTAALNDWERTLRQHQESIRMGSEDGNQLVSMHSMGNMLTLKNDSEEYDFCGACLSSSFDTCFKMAQSLFSTMPSQNLITLYQSLYKTYSTSPGAIRAALKSMDKSQSLSLLQYACASDKLKSYLTTSQTIKSQFKNAIYNQQEGIVDKSKGTHSVNYIGVGDSNSIADGTRYGAAISRAYNEWEEVMKSSKQVNSNAKAYKPQYSAAISKASDEWEEVMEASKKATPNIKDYKPRYNAAISRAYSEWQEVMNASKQAKAQAVSFAAVDAITCKACEGLTDKECLSALDALVLTLNDSERLALYKSLFPEDAARCSYVNAVCLESLQGVFDALSDKSRLAELTIGCSGGYLNHVSEEKPDITAFKPQYSAAISRAYSEWQEVMNASKQAKAHAVSFAAVDAITCKACEGLTDKECLSALDALVLTLNDFERLALYKSLFPEDAAHCSYVNAVCLESLQGVFDALSDKSRLAELTVGCSGGYLTHNTLEAESLFNVRNFVDQPNFSSAPPQMSNSAPFFIFAVSATMAIMLGLMVSFVVRKKRARFNSKPGMNRLGPIYEYTTIS